MLRPIQIPSTLRPPQATESRLINRYMSGAEKNQSAPSMLDLMIEKASEVNQMQHRSDAMVHELLTGGDVNSAEVLTSVQKADMAFRTMLQVRNKLIEAYREILQIQV